MASARLRAVPQPQAPSGVSKDEVIDELRELVADLRDAAADGRMLAAKYAALLTACVDEYCTEFEKRADAALQRLEQAQ